MKYLTFLTIVGFWTFSVLASTKKEWLTFIYRVENGDKLAHFIGAALLSFILAFYFSSLSKFNRMMPTIRAVIVASSFVAVEETLQLMIPSRQFSMVDLAWGISGALFAGLIAALINKNLV